MGILLILAGVGYLIGSLPFGYWAGRLLGADVRHAGSGNIGATNVFRVLGPIPGTLVLLADVAKGAVSAHLGLALGGDLAPWAATVAGVAAIAGHNWSYLLNFRGGKGVATAAGVALSLITSAALVGLLVLVAVVLITRYVSLGSLTAATVVALVVLVAPNPLPYRILAVLAAVLIYVRHLPNIRRLLAGQELRLGDSPRSGN